MSTTKEKSEARKYYKEHAAYRRKKIDARKEYYHDHQTDQNAYAREYYHSHPSYRKYKIRYARDYRKAQRGKR